MWFLALCLKQGVNVIRAKGLQGVSEADNILLRGNKENESKETELRKTEGVAFIFLEIVGDRKQGIERNFQDQKCE